MKWSQITDKLIESKQLQFYYIGKCIHVYFFTSPPPTDQSNFCMANDHSIQRTYHTRRYHTECITKLPQLQTRFATR